MIGCSRPDAEACYLCTAGATGVGHGCTHGCASGSAAAAADVQHAAHVTYDDAVSCEFFFFLAVSCAFFGL